MQIMNIALTDGMERVRLSCRIEWEDCDQPSKDIFIEADKPFGNDLAANPHAFLVGCLIPAMHWGEKRIKLAEEICPYLKEGLDTVMAIMRLWSK